MKKIVAMIICIILLVPVDVLAVTNSTLSDNKATIIVSDKNIQFETQFEIADNQIMVPVKSVFSKIGYYIKESAEAVMVYDSNDFFVVTDIAYGETGIYLSTGNLNEYEQKKGTDYLEKNTVFISSTIERINNEIVVPITMVSYFGDYNVSEDQNSKIIYLNKNTTNTTSYYNATNEVFQIYSYIEQGMYLEAAALCEQTLTIINLSPEDRYLIDNLRIDANNKYADYMNSVQQVKHYYVSDWCMWFEFLSEYQPTAHNNDIGTEWVNIYDNANSGISIESYQVGTMGRFSYIQNPTQYISQIAKYYKDNFHDCNGRATELEILSENDTVVGNLPARQVTFRCSTELNRYGTVKDYNIYKYIAFQYGDWVYLIEAQEDAYLWSDTFWNMMEMVRNSVFFY